MADLNALIAQGYQPQAPIDPFAQYAKMQQLNVGQNQNALAQYQLAQAQRADQEANALRQSLPAEFDLNNPSHVNAVLRASPVGGAALIEKLAKVKNDMLTGQKTQGEIAAQPGARAETEARTNSLAVKTLDENLGIFNKMYSPLAAAAAGAQGVTDYVTALYDHPILGSVASKMKPLDAALRENLAAFQADPKQWIAAHSQLNGQGILDTMKGTRQNTNLGGTSRGETIDVYGRVVPNSSVDTPVTMTPFQKGELANMAAGRALTAIQADPFNLTGAQTAYPLGMGGGAGVSVGGVTGARPAASSVAPTADTISGKQIPLGEAINKGLTGPELLSVMPKNLAGQVNAILEHRAAPPSGNTARASQLMQIVQAADPTYDAQQYKTKQGIEIAFTQGLPSRTLKSINVANDHLKVLNSTIDALNNGDVKLFNQFGNAVATQIGVPAPTDFNAVKQIVADELVKAVVGGTGALGDRKTIAETINAANSPAALRSVINRYQQLMEGQRNGLADQYKSGGGNNAEVLRLFGRKAEANAPAASQGTGGFKYLGKE